MTGQQSTTIRQVREGLQGVASIATIAGIVWLIVVWLTGGLRPETQIQLQQLTAQVESLKKTTEMLSSRLDALPRPSDYTALDGHLSRTDALVAVTIDRLTKDEIENAAIRAEVQQLHTGTGTPVRQPR